MASNGRKTNLIGKYPDNYLECRAMGHAWDRVGFYKLERSTYRVRVLRCLRCTKGKREIIDRDDRVESRSYQDPTGYALPRDESPALRGPWIREQFRRVEVVVIKDISEIHD